MLLYLTQLNFSTPPPPLFYVLTSKTTALCSFVFQLGDIIVAIDNQEINTEADLFKVLESRKPGDEIAITAER